jgi:ABC-2 type transport system ATP-binding protein
MIAHPSVLSVPAPALLEADDTWPRSAAAVGPALEVEDLVVEYGSLRAVDGVSFRLAPGEVLGFLGPNGAGKSTTIHVLATLLRPTRGRVRVLGFDAVRQAGEIRRRLGLVMQRSCVDVMLNVRENLYLYAGLHRIPVRERRRRIDEILELFGLADRADAAVHLLSSGLLRRVALARAFLADCEILFLDEPTAGVDPRARAAFHDFLREVCRRTGLTIFLATHDLDEAERLCTQIAFIRQGKLLALASPAELKAAIDHSVLAIEFESPVQLPADLERAPGVVAVRLQGVRRAEIDVAGSAARALDVLMRLKSAGTVQNFTLRPPSLEDVFLKFSRG